MTPSPMPEEGDLHLIWIGRFQLLLLGLGALLWALRSWRAGLVFTVTGLASLGFWHLHRWVVGRMLTPSVRKRWVYGFLGLLKLALIAIVLRGMMSCFPGEGIPLAIGILVFVGGILLEAFRLMLWPGSHEGSDKG
jgi:hypothetical protein